jgi:hypothetical protein
LLSERLLEIQHGIQRNFWSFSMGIPSLSRFYSVPIPQWFSLLKMNHLENQAVEAIEQFRELSERLLEIQHGIQRDFWSYSMGIPFLFRS